MITKNEKRTIPPFIFYLIVVATVLFFALSGCSGTSDTPNN